jgi:tRNA nucleotidyltransferase (CCA-adding enzyme)
LAKRHRQVLAAVADILAWWKLAAVPAGFEAWRVVLYGLIALLRADETAAFAERLGLSGPAKARMLRDKDDAESILAKLSRRPKLTPSLVYRIAEGASVEAVLLAMAKTYREPTRRALAAHLTQHAATRTAIAGRDLRALGVAPGPVYGEILARVLDARLDGKARTKAEELALVKRLLKKENVPRRGGRP